MPKKIVIWSPEARADLRAIDRETALRVLRAIDAFLENGVGDYRVLFLLKEQLTIEILRVLHRKDAYR